MTAKSEAGSSENRNTYREQPSAMGTGVESIPHEKPDAWLKDSLEILRPSFPNSWSDDN